MALLIKRGPTKKLNNTPDWDSFLYSHWLQKIALNPGHYDDAKKSHVLGHGKCGCTRSFVLDVRKKK